MKKALIYTLSGTLLSFIFNYFFTESAEIWLELFYAFSFGAAWGVAYFLDSATFSLPQKLLISFGIMILLVMFGSIFFGLEKSIPAIFKFSMVFVGYYLLASFKGSKSLRN